MIDPLQSTSASLSQHNADPQNRFWLRSVPVLLFCLLTGVLISMRVAADEPESLTVMTWNLEWFYDEFSGDNYSKLSKEKSAPSRAQWDWRRDQVAKRIASVQPTVLALQEVENRRVLWYLTRALDRDHSLEYHELGVQSRDHFTEQDVGILYREPAELLLTKQFALTQRMRKQAQYYDVTKHLWATFEFPVGERFEPVHVLNVHLRSGERGATPRRRQARLIHHWISAVVQAGEHVIVLGDFNTEHRGQVIEPDSDLGILIGKSTDDPADDLIDLNSRLPRGQRRTHLLPDREFDRICCTRSLVEDDPNRLDLVFDSIRVRPDLTIQGQRDEQQAHWERYWQIPRDQRDLSDHYPVVATFEVR